MQLKTFLPCAYLRPYIEKYFLLEDDSHIGVWEQNLLPLVMECLSFNFSGDNFKVITKREGLIDIPLSYVVGTLTGKATGLINGTLKTLTVHFKPGSLYKIFKTPVHLFIERAIALRDIIGSEARILEEKFFNTPKIEDAIKILETFLISRIDNYNLNYRIQLIEHSIDKLIFAQGNLQINRIQRELNVTKKTIERHFNEIVGIPPKTYAGIIRFNVVLHALQRTRSTKIIELLYSLGYSDYAHFTNDFKKFTGQSPTQYLNLSTEFENFFYSGVKEAFLAHDVYNI